MAVVVAVITEDALKYWLSFFGGIMGTPGTPTVPGAPPVTWDPRIKFFKVGEGGWINNGVGYDRRSPVGSLRRLSAPLIQDLDAVVDPTRAPADQRYAANERATFSKSVTPSEVSFTAPATIEVECLLDFPDFNDDGFGNDPEIWEIALFSDHPGEPGLGAGQGLMVCYGTFPKQTKNATKQILNKVRIVSRSAV